MINSSAMKTLFAYLMLALFAMSSMAQTKTDPPKFQHQLMKTPLVAHGPSMPPDPWDCGNCTPDCACMANCRCAPGTGRALYSKEPAYTARPIVSTCALKPPKDVSKLP